MTYEVKCLDHGFVKLRNLAGPTRRATYTQGGEIGARAFDADDRDPAQAARMSFEQMDSDRTYGQDMKLNRYLLEHDHTSPFEMISVWVEVKVPIFIDRQLVRHRTWRRNESSGRYIILPDEYYIPDEVGAAPTDGAKQGQSGRVDPKTEAWFQTALRSACQDDYATYIEAVERGVAKEEARMFLHVNHYVHWLGNVDLGNMFRFLRLRDHSHAQKQARVYAEAIITLLHPHLPGLMGLYEELVKQHD